MKGQSIANVKAGIGHIALELPANGLYVVRVNTTDGSFTYKVFVK